MKAALIAALIGAGIVLAPPAHAKDCEHRSAAHIAEHGGLHADSAWHVAHGEKPTCGAKNDNIVVNNRDQKNDKSWPKFNRGYDGDDDKDKKSRFCRKRWWC